jgi:predicted PurR-regulated permease PerM
MTRQKKIILTALFSFFIFALAFGIYLFPDNAPMIAEQSDTALKQAPPPQPQKNSSDSSLKEKLPMNIAPDSNSVQTEQADAAALETNPYVSYPESLFELLEINMDELLNGRDAFKNTIIHVEWMDHINDILKNLDPVKR